MAYKVFISASYKDRDLARDIGRRLKEAKAHVTYSELSMSAGTEFEKTFMKLLQDSDEIIVVLTNNSVDNLWMMFEIGAASSLRKKITPVVVGLEEKELPSVIKQLKHIKYDRLSKHISMIERNPQAA